MINFFKKHWEVLSYLVFGVLCTLLNIVLYAPGSYTHLRLFMPSRRTTYRKMLMKSRYNVSAP